MSTREMAYNIFNRLNDEQLRGFVALFGSLFTVDEDASQKARKMKAMQEIESMIRPIDVDYDKELEEYREEKYGH